MQNEGFFVASKTKVSVLRSLFSHARKAQMQYKTMHKHHLFSILLLAMPFVACTQNGNLRGDHPAQAESKNTNKMQVEIWSDIVCPFCYIGKRKFEQALDQSPYKNQIKVVWKSFQLDPDAPAMGMDYLKNLSERKGWSMEQTRQITDNVTKMAAEVGLEYHFEKAIAANSFDAHRLSHLAQQYGLQDALEEALFRAHFVEGKNIAEHAVLASLGTSIGLSASEIIPMLEGDRFADAVQRDIEEAQQLRVSGVPFFVFDRKYAVSGAQSSEVFLQSLTKAFEDWKAKN